MIEIHQSNYNPDELAWEVIDSIADLLKGGAALWSADFDRLLESDRKLFEKVANGDDSNSTRDQWLGAEDEWRSMGASFGISVYDDGDAGWTYVGTEEEVGEFLDAQEKESE